METRKRENPSGLSFPGKIAFSMGNFTQWFVNSAFNTWVFFFYYVAIGLNVNYIMTAYIIWTLWNAANDPLIGYISDRTRTRFGRRKPFIMIGTIPLAVLEVILWLPPRGDPLLTFIYLLVMLLCYDTFFTMIALPFDALFPELFTSVEERAQVNTLKQVLATIGLLMAFLVPGIFIGTGDEPAGYLVNGIVTSIIVAVSLAIPLIWGTPERPEFKMDHVHHFDFFQGLKYTFRNKGFVLYTAMYFLYNYVLLVLSNTVPLFAREVLKAPTQLFTSILLGLMFIVGLATVVVWRKLDVKIGSRKAYAISIIAYFFSSIPLLFISDYWSGVATAMVMGFGFGGMLYFIYLLIADVIDEDELQTGVRREGTFFGIANFFMRLSMVGAIVTVSLVLSNVGLEEYIGISEVENLEGAVLGLRALVVLFPGIALGISLLCLHYYPFPQSRVDEVKEKLRVLHEEKRQRIRNEEPDRL